MRWAALGVYLFAAAVAVGAAFVADAKPPRYGLHLVDGGTTPLVQETREVLRLRATFVPYKAAAASLVDHDGRTLAWREGDGSVHVAEGVTAEDVARVTFEVADSLAETTRAAMNAMRGAYR